MKAKSSSRCVPYERPTAFIGQLLVAGALAVLSGCGAESQGGTSAGLSREAESSGKPSDVVPSPEQATASSEVAAFTRAVDQPAAAVPATGGSPLEVPCRIPNDGRNTFLSAVVKELGLGYLTIDDAYEGSGGPTGPLTLALQGAGGEYTFCDSACEAASFEEMKQAIVTAKASGDPAFTSLPPEEQPWVRAPFADIDGRAIYKAARFVLAVDKKGQWKVITTTKALRALIGPIDSPWKAHLWLFAQPGKYQVECNVSVPARYSWVRPKPVQTFTSYVRTAGPINIVDGIESPPSCSPTAEAFRVALGVDANGVVTAQSRTLAWTGSTGCF